MKKKRQNEDRFDGSKGEEEEEGRDEVELTKSLWLERRGWRSSCKIKKGVSSRVRIGRRGIYLLWDGHAGG